MMCNKPPAGVRFAGTCLAFGGIVSFLFSVGMLVTGHFSGLHVFGPGLVMFGLGYLGLTAASRIDQRRPISRTLGLVWGIAVLICVVALVLASMLSQESDKVGVIILSSTFGLLAICVVASLTIPSTVRWYALESTENSEDYKEPQ